MPRTSWNRVRAPCSAMVSVLSVPRGASGRSLAVVRAMARRPTTRWRDARCMGRERGPFAPGATKPQARVRGVLPRSRSASHLVSRLDSSSRHWSPCPCTCRTLSSSARCLYGAACAPSPGSSAGRPDRAAAGRPGGGPVHPQATARARRHAGRPPADHSARSGSNSHARAAGLGLVAISQDVRVVLEDAHGRTMAENAATALLLGQSPETPRPLARVYELSADEQADLLAIGAGRDPTGGSADATADRRGEGLLPVAGQRIWLKPTATRPSGCAWTRRPRVTWSCATCWRPPRRQPTAGMPRRSRPTARPCWSGSPSSVAPPRPRALARPGMTLARARSH